jgi:hypothetical protein
VEEGVRALSIENQIEQLAWVVLRAANRTQAKGSTARLIVPRAPEVAEDLDLELTDHEFLSVEEYLLDHGYVAPADIVLTWGTYTATPAGLRWLEASLPEPSPMDPLRELADQPGEETAFESALRAEVEEERQRLEEVERELNEAAPEARESPESPGPMETPTDAGGGPQAITQRPSTEDEPERRGFWSRLFRG